MSNNKTKLAGATRKGKRWQSSISVNGVYRYLGMFDTEEQAHQTYLNACEELGREPMGSTVQDRFDTKYAVNPDTDCWNWTAGKNYKGYGKFNALGETLAHRVSWLLHNGPIPEDKPVVRHKACRNRACVNPDHLEVGTHQDNSDDMIEDGTSTKGEANPNAQLTAEDIEVIKWILAHRLPGHVPQKMIAEMFGVSQPLISRIATGRNWGHVTLKGKAAV